MMGRTQKRRREFQLKGERDGDRHGWITVIYQQMFEHFRKQDEVQAAVIGAGQYATAIVTQESQTEYLRVTVVADLDVQAAKQAYLRAGAAEDQLVYCETAE